MATKKKNEKKLGWHFLPADMRLTYSDRRQAKVGETLSIPDSQTPYPCSVGMHASDKPNQAARYGRGPVLTRVEVWGDLHTQYDKFCGRHRRVIWAKEVTDADLKPLEKDLGITHPSRSITDRLYSAACSDPDAFDNWAMHFMAGVKSGKPRLSKEILLGLFTPGVVRTHRELVAALKGSFDLKSDSFGDKIEELIDDLSSDLGFHVIEDFDGTQDGYVISRPRSKRRGG